MRLMELLGIKPEEVERWLVWQKGAPIPGHDQVVWRRDFAGFVIRYADFGNRGSAYGWEVDHVVPTALKGSDDLRNKRPVNWYMNVRMGAQVREYLRRRG